MTPVPATFKIAQFVGGPSSVAAVASGMRKIYSRALSTPPGLGPDDKDPDGPNNPRPSGS